MHGVQFFHAPYLFRKHGLCAVMNTESQLEAGRTAARQQAWDDAFVQLTAADEGNPLELDDLEVLALAAYMAGKEYECARTWTRAHQECIRRGDPRRAARCAFWQACGLLFKGDLAPALGWIARGRRVLEGEPDCPEQAWLLGLTGLPLMFQGDPGAALPYFVQACEIAGRFNDPDVQTFGRLAQGTALVVLGETASGVSLLDEVMVAVTAGEVSPIIAGIAYCQVIDTCQEIFDLRRAREWTAALSLWCDLHPDIVPYRGNCLVHRCEILQSQGAWPEALEAAQAACDWLGTLSGSDMLGSAHYQLGEIHRLRGESEKAEECYRRASQAGRDPEPGMSLLRLARGKIDLAAGAIRRVAHEAQGSPTLPRVLPAYIEIMIAANDIEAARSAADELSEIAAAVDAPALRGLASQATGAVLTAEGDGGAALDLFRNAARIWQEIDVPYETGRVRLLIAIACRALGDEDSAAMEFDAARQIFEQLGAATDLARVEKLANGSIVSPPPGGLTARETQVLTLLAKGKTNREISEALTISEHTVARHVQNIFAKLGVTTRTAAGAYAYEHDLVNAPSGPN